MFFCYFVISQQLIANFAMLLGNMLPQVKNNTNISHLTITLPDLSKNMLFTVVSRGQVCRLQMVLLDTVGGFHCHAIKI